MRDPRIIAEQWHAVATRDGLEACARSIRDDVVKTSEDQLDALRGAVRLLTSGFFLASPDVEALEAIITLESNRGLDADAVESEDMRKLRARRDELRKSLQDALAANRVVVADAEACRSLRVQRDQLQRAIAEARQSLIALEGGRR